MNRRQFLHMLSAAGAVSSLPGMPLLDAMAPAAQTKPGRILNEYSLFLPGEAEALQQVPQLLAMGAGTVTVVNADHQQHLALGDHVNGWLLAAVFDMNGVSTAVFEKHVTHRGALAYVTVRGGTIALIPKSIGDLAQIRPRQIAVPGGVALKRPLRITPGPDVTGDFLLRSNEDPCYENVAALGPEYVGWTLVSSEGAGPVRSVYLEADGTTREPKHNTKEAWAPDMEGPVFNPGDYFPFAAPEQYEYKPGFSKRTLLGGYLPVADTGVWNAEYNCGYELIMLLPRDPEARPVARMRVRLSTSDIAQHTSGSLVHDPDGHVYAVHFWNTNADAFFQELAGTWNQWSGLYEDVMPVEIPDPWLLDAARAGITLSRCSYRGLEPTYQVGEGGIHPGAGTQSRPVSRRPLRVHLGPSTVGAYGAGPALRAALPGQIHPAGRELPLQHAGSGRRPTQCRHLSDERSTRLLVHAERARPACATGRCWKECSAMCWIGTTTASGSSLRTTGVTG